MVDGDKFLTIFNMKMTHVKYLVVLSCHSFANIYKKRNKITKKKEQLNTALNCGAFSILLVSFISLFIEQKALWLCQSTACYFFFISFCFFA